MLNQLRLHVAISSLILAAVAVACSGTGGDTTPADPLPPTPTPSADASTTSADATTDAGPECTKPADCASKVCVGGKCAAPTCTDATKNGAETDADCGGTCSTKCADGKGCAAAADCTSAVCTTGHCAVPACNDTIKNGTEADTDCGGSCATKCADGKKCALPADCVTGVCTTGTCTTAACSDAVKNGDETDTDCGGSCVIKCADTKTCLAAGDCMSGVCTGNHCQVPACDDTVKNGDETDTDCGGSCATKCVAGKACLANADCTNGACLGNVCYDLPTAGLAAHYDARNTASITAPGGNVTAWADLSGNGRTLTTAAGTPVYGAALIGGKPGINFASAKMTTAAFALTTDVTVFAVFQYRASGQWGPIAHHGSRDNDWSMEQSGFDYPSNVMHWQSGNDNTTLELTFSVGTNYITAGRITGSGAPAARYFSATSTAGGTLSTTGTNSTISAGSKVLYVGGSDVNEFSNHYIGELVYFTRSVTDAERDSIVAYLKANWGI